MEHKFFLTALIVYFLILSGCTSIQPGPTSGAPASITIPTATPIGDLPKVTTIPGSALTRTSTPVLQTSTPSADWIPQATPLNLSYGTSDEIILIIDKLFPGRCIKNIENLLTVKPTPIEPAMQVSPLRFIEITAVPEPNPNYINERADNLDNSRTAYAGCQPRDCSKLYVKDNKISKIYEVKFAASTYGPLDSLQWINKDTVVVEQQGHLWTLIVAINVEKQQFEYYGMTPGCANVIPTP